MTNQVSVPRELVLFLLGEGPLDGLWFGDSKPEKPAAKHWWRKQLREAMAAPAAAPSQDDVQKSRPCLRDPAYDENLDGPCSAGLCQWPECKPLTRGAYQHEQEKGDE